MSDVPPKIVVRTYAPVWGWVLRIGLLTAIAVALFGAFAFGLYKAGFDAMRASSAREGLQQQVDQLQQAQRQLRLQLASAEEARVAQVRERTELARSIGELQAQVERQQQDVEFYRGLVAQPMRLAGGLVRVQQFHISPASQPQQFVLRFTLDRVLQPEQVVSGVLAISVEGSANGMPATVDWATLTGGKEQLGFDFRYYEHLDQPISLPAAFKPDSVTIEVKPARNGASSYRQTFIWDVDPS